MTELDASRDPIGILEQQNQGRVSELVPLRNERMAATPFTFYRGTAAIMAADQANSSHSGLLVASCGDAHISNFGFYASPQRTLLFDLNDFDESAWAPWEWDLERLVTSVIIGGMATGRSEEVTQKSASAAVTAYMRTLRLAGESSPLARYFTHFDPESARKQLDPESREALKASVKAAEKKTGDRAVKKLTEPGEAGRLRFSEAPPVTTHLDPELESLVQDRFDRYQRSANTDIRLLMQQYEIDDVARRVVGVGSVGTRCYITLLRDRDGGSLILQVKEAGRSVLEQYGRVEQPAEFAELVAEQGQGGRVVALQRILQSLSDPFLGHIRGTEGDYYIRQFRDMKGSVEAETLGDKPFRQYAIACAAVLARAHAQSPAAAEVVRSFGGGKRVRRSILDWCSAYAETAVQDHREFVDYVAAQA